MKSTGKKLTHKELDRLLYCYYNLKKHGNNILDLELKSYLQDKLVNIQKLYKCSERII